VTMGNTDGMWDVGCRIIVQIGPRSYGRGHALVPLPISGIGISIDAPTSLSQIAAEVLRLSLAVRQAFPTIYTCATHKVEIL
jgi:hypothetical protein